MRAERVGKMIVPEGSTSSTRRSASHPAQIMASLLKAGTPQPCGDQFERHVIDRIRMTCTVELPWWEAESPGLMIATPTLEVAGVRTAAEAPLSD
jgi:hypothetical protein